MGICFSIVNLFKSSPVMRYSAAFKILVFGFVLIPYFIVAQQNMAGFNKFSKSDNILDKGGAVDFLPFFNKSLKKNNFTSPKPFGIAFSSMIYQQEYISKNLRIKGETVTGIEVFARGDSVSQQTTAGELKGYIKPNIWLFPFLNVYGIFGFTTGEIRHDLFIDGIIIEDLPGIGDYYIDTTFILNDEIRYNGQTFGFGTTLSFGIYPYAFLLDYHYTVTSPSDLEGKMHNHFLSPKFGYYISTKNKNLKIMAWLGAMYFMNDQSFTGEITVEEIAPELVLVFGEKALYSGEIEAIHNWNMLAGINLNIKQKHLVFLEIGFINRIQASIGYGFLF